MTSVAKVAEKFSEETIEGLYQSDPLALPSQSASWIRALLKQEAVRDASRCYEFTGNRRALMQLYEGRGALGLYGTWNSPPPAWGFGGTLSNNALTSEELAMILQDVEANAPVQVKIRPNPLVADLWHAAAGPRWQRIQRNTHILDLSGGFEEVWTKRFKPRTRSAVRKAEREGLEVEVGNNPRLVEELYGLFNLSVARWAGKQNENVLLARLRAGGRDPVSKLHGIAEAMGSTCRIWIARHNGEPAAAILVLLDRNAHYTRGAMKVEIAGPTGANLLLHKLAIEEACAKGCAVYNMGETGQSQSLAQFKSRFGAEPTFYNEYVFERVPVHRVDRFARTAVKRLIRFKDV